MNDDSLESKTKEQLLALAKDLDVSVSRSLLKRELIALLKQSLAKKPKKAKAASAVGVKAKKAAKESTSKRKSLQQKSEKAIPALVSAGHIEDMAQEAKFLIGHPQIKDETREEFTQELPSNYGFNKLALMIRDPYWVYSYWEIQQDKIEKGLKALGGPLDEIRWVLRVFSARTNGKNPAAPVTDIEVQPHARNWYLHLTPAGASFCAEIGLMDRRNNFYCLATSNTITLPLDRPSDVIDEQWMTSDEEFQKLYALCGGHRMGAGVGSGSEAVRKGQQFPFGASSWGVSSFVSSLLSPPPVERERKFWFWVDAELIVYGGTEPGAKVTLCGQRIQLRPDGTFTARFALPDGTQTIPVSAESTDGVEVRTIIPIVSRNTERPEPVFQKEE